jgi:hypothetical protein
MIEAQNSKASKQFRVDPEYKRELFMYAGLRSGFVSLVMGDAPRLIAGHATALFASM